MIRRSLGSTDMVISVIGLGAFAMGGWMWGPQDDADSLAAIRAALDAGVNWIDTAPIYGSGRSEELIGRALRDLGPSHRPLIFTKFGHHLEGQERRTCASATAVRADCEASLRRLGVERIDLFQLHWPAPEPLEETAGTCAQLLAEGKIRAIGVSNFSLEQLTSWTATGVPLHAVQNPYSLLRREAEADILPWCARTGTAFLAYSPLHRGLLTGGWSPERVLPAGDHRAERPDWRQPRLGRILAAVEELRALGQELDMGVAELALGALLSCEGCTACIVGARNAQQGAKLGEFGMPLRSTTLDQVNAITDRLLQDLAVMAEGAAP